MYKKSKLTGKIYFNNVEVIQDDRLEEWQIMYQWQLNGGTFEEVEFVESELMLLKEIKINEIKQIQYQELSITDWYFTRYIETGQEVPLEIKKQRLDIKEKYDNLIREIKNE